MSIPDLKEGYGLGNFISDSIELTKIITNVSVTMAKAAPGMMP
jgi:hypothetical protein